MLIATKPQSSARFHHGGNLTALEPKVNGYSGEVSSATRIRFASAAVLPVGALGAPCKTHDIFFCGTTVHKPGQPGAANSCENVI